MAFLVKGNSFPQLRSYTPKVYDLLSLSRRGLHNLLPHQRAQLEKDPKALSLYLSIRKHTRTCNRFVVVMTVTTLAVFGYIGYDNARIQEKAQKKFVEEVLKEIGEEAQEKARKSDLW